MPIYDYKCPDCGHVREVITNGIKYSPKCNNIRTKYFGRPVGTCGQEMLKMVSAPGLLVTNFHDKPSVRRTQ